MALPNFLIVGAPRCGTTSLHAYLGQHPDVFMPDTKEPLFFAMDPSRLPLAGPNGDVLSRHIVVDRDAYLGLFEGSEGAGAVGEASTWYLHDEGAARRIASDLPQARIIAVAREPVERMWSSFLHLRSHDWEPEAEFRRALELEQERRDAGWEPLYGYRALSRYSEAVGRYLRLVGPERVRVVLFEEMQNDPVAVARSLFSFLGVDPAFVPDVSHQSNRSTIPSSATLHGLLHGQSRLRHALGRCLPLTWRRALVEYLDERNRTRPRMDPELAASLRAEFTDDIARLESLLDVDLSAWRQASSPSSTA